MNDAGPICSETFDEFLADQGILEECEDLAMKEIVAEQSWEASEEQRITR